MLFLGRDLAELLLMLLLFSITGLRLLLLVGCALPELILGLLRGRDLAELLLPGRSFTGLWLMPLGRPFTGLWLKRCFVAIGLLLGLLAGLLLKLLLRGLLLTALLPWLLL